MGHGVSSRSVVRRLCRQRRRLRAVRAVGVSHRRHPAADGRTLGVPAHAPSALVRINQRPTDPGIQLTRRPS